MDDLPGCDAMIQDLMLPSQTSADSSVTVPKQDHKLVTDAIDSISQVTSSPRTVVVLCSVCGCQTLQSTANGKHHVSVLVFRKGKCELTGGE